MPSIPEETLLTGIHHKEDDCIEQSNDREHDVGPPYNTGVIHDGIGTIRREPLGDENALIPGGQGIDE